MSDIDNLLNYDLINQNITCQQIPFPPSVSTLSQTLATVPYFMPLIDPKVDTYCPMYPCPHKDLFHIARQIDKIHDLECQYQYDSYTFVIKDTERNRTLGILGKDTKANQIILQCEGYNDRVTRLITLDLDCDLLALIQMGCSIRGLYRVNSVE